MKKLKRLIDLFASSALLGALLLSSIACSNLGGSGKPKTGSLSNVGNETFCGLLSEASYETAEKAAEAFLEEEISGSTSRATFVSYSKTADLSQSELEELELGEIALSEIQSAEIGQVAYTLSLSENSSLAFPFFDFAATPGTRTQTLYVLGVSDDFRYFVPSARNGEMITKSYFDHMSDPSKYTNYTADLVMTMGMDIRDATHRAKVTVDISILLKETEHAAYMKMGVTSHAEGDDADLIENSLGGGYQDVEAYIAEQNGVLYACVLYQGNWNVNVLSGYHSLNEWVDENNRTMPQFLDYTYFEKTDTGFALAPEKFDLFAKNYFEYINFPYASETDFNGEATYFVESGHLSKSTIRISSSYSDSGASMNIQASAACDYIDFQSTVITLPDELLQYLAEK